MPSKCASLRTAISYRSLLKRNEVGHGELDRIVSTLKTFYESQKPADEIIKWGRIEKLKISTRENFRQTEDLRGRHDFGARVRDDPLLHRRVLHAQCPPL